MALSKSKKPPICCFCFVYNHKKVSCFLSPLSTKIESSVLILFIPVDLLFTIPNTTHGYVPSVEFAFLEKKKKAQFLRRFFFLLSPSSNPLSSTYPDSLPREHIVIVTKFRLIVFQRICRAVTDETTSIPINHFSSH